MVAVYPCSHRELFFQPGRILASGVLTGVLMCARKGCLFAEVFSCTQVTNFAGNYCASMPLCACREHAKRMQRLFQERSSGSHRPHRDHLSSGPASLGLVALTGHARSWCCSYGNAMAVQCPAGLPDLRARLPNRYRASFTRWLVIQQFNLFELIEMSSAQCSLVRLVKSFYQRNS